MYLVQTVEWIFDTCAQFLYRSLLEVRKDSAAVNTIIYIYVLSPDWLWGWIQSFIFSYMNHKVCTLQKCIHLQFCYCLLKVYTWHASCNNTTKHKGTYIQSESSNCNKISSQISSQSVRVCMHVYWIYLHIQRQYIIIFKFKENTCRECV